MSARVLHSALAVLVAAVVAACTPPAAAQLHVLGVQAAPAHETVVFVQVLNRAARALRLSRIEYNFAAAGEAPTHRAVELSRDIEAGGTTVVELPVEFDEPTMNHVLKLDGLLLAQLDQLEQTFRVSATVNEPTLMDAPTVPATVQVQ